MATSFEQLFRRLPEREMPEGMTILVIDRIRARTQRAARMRLVASATAAFLSLAASVPAFGYVLGALSRSGFWQYLSLAFSDGSAVFGAWNNFALLLAESFPFTETAVFLSLVFALLLSVKFAMQNAGATRFGARLAHN